MDETKYLVYEHQKFIEVIYALCDVPKGHKDAFINRDADRFLRTLRPVNKLYHGYFRNFVYWEDPRDPKNKTYTEEWTRTPEHKDDELERQSCIMAMNKRIKDYNEFVDEHIENIGIENIEHQKFYPSSEYPLWCVVAYLEHNTIDNSFIKKDEVVPMRTLNNQWIFHRIGYSDFVARLNKTIYDWICNVSPYEMNENHVLYLPKQEFENWFMIKGIPSDSIEDIFQEFDESNETEVGRVKEELNILKNEHRVTTNKLKQALERLKEQRFPPLKAITEMKRMGIIDKYVEEHRMVNGKFNASSIAKDLDCDPKTIKKIFENDPDLRHLLTQYKSDVTIATTYD